jgi:hypothetical protein
LLAETDYGQKRNGHVHLEMLTLQDLLQSGACVNLRRRKSITQLVNINRLYELSEPGKYFIRVRTADPESTALDKSNTVRVTIVP